MPLFLKVDSSKDIKLWARLMISVIIGVLFFLIALSWNDSIMSTIDFYTAERDFLIPTQKELISSWVYTIVITFILIITVYLFRNYLKQSFLHLESSGEGSSIGQGGGLSAAPIPFE